MLSMLLSPQGLLAAAAAFMVFMVWRRRRYAYRMENASRYVPSNIHGWVAQNVHIIC